MAIKVNQFWPQFASKKLYFQSLQSSKISTECAIEAATLPRHCLVAWSESVDVGVQKQYHAFMTMLKASHDGKWRYSTATETIEFGVGFDFTIDTSVVDPMATFCAAIRWEDGLPLTFEQLLPLRRLVYRSAGGGGAGLPDGQSEFSARSLMFEPPVSEATDLKVLENRARVVTHIVKAVSTALEDGLDALLRPRAEAPLPDYLTHECAIWSFHDLCITRVSLSGQFDLQATQTSDDRTVGVINISIQDAFELFAGEKYFECDPFMVTTLAPALLVHDQALESIIAHRNGSLELRFGTGMVVLTEPSPEQYSWQIGGSGVFEGLAIGSSGGGVTVFSHFDFPSARWENRLLWPD